MPPAAINGLLQSAYGQILLRNARSFPVELESYASLRVQRGALPDRLCCRHYFCQADYSPPFNSIVAEQLQAVLPHHTTALLEGQEHNAMASAPELFAQVLHAHLR